MAAREEREALIQLAANLRGGEHLCAHGGELHRERQTVEPADDRGDVIVRLERRHQLACACGEQRDRVVDPHRLDGILVLGVEVEPFAARGQHVSVEGGDDRSCLGQELLEVVEQEQHPAAAQERTEVLLRPDRRPDRRLHERRIRQRGQGDEPHAVGEVVDDVRRSLQGQARLPGSTGPSERDQPMGAYELRHLRQLALTTDQRHRLHGQVRLVQALQRRELTLAELEDPLRRGQVLEPVLAEVTQTVLARKVARRLRHQHLPTVTRSRDPRRSMDVDADIAVLRQQRLARVDTHPHPDRAVQRLAGFPRSRERVRRTRERDEEGVALRVDLDAVVARERRAQHLPVLGQRVRIRLPELVQKPRRALDVREEEGDRAARELTHERIMRRRRVVV